MTKCKLQHYFDAHPITVVSKYLLGEVIQNPKAEGRIAKWALELMGQNITFAPSSAIKSQVLADFVAEWTEMQAPPVKIEHETWIMYFDGSVMKEGARVGLFFISPQGMHMEYMVRLHFPSSNNAAEYYALINDLQIAVELGIKRLEITGDSELVVGQVMKDKNCVDPKMAAYCQAVRELEGKFMDSSCTTCCATTTRRLTCLRKRHPIAARLPMGSSRAINISHSYEKRARSYKRSRGPRSWQSASHRK
jgi:ribonuclease HI